MNLRFSALIFATTVLSAALLSSCVAFNRVDMDFMKKPQVQLEAIGGTEKGEKKIVVVPLNGMIVPDREDYFFMPHNEITPNGVRRALTFLQNEKDLGAVVFDLNSPGGSAATSEEIYQMLLSFKAKKNVPIIFYINNIGASGGYYIAQSADQIIVNPNGVVGSVGVLSVFVRADKLLKNKLDLDFVTIKTGKFKDFGSPLREMSKEEIAYWTQMMDIYFGHFINVVATGRKMPAQKVREFADGRVFAPTVALDKKMIDGVGTLDTAMETAQRLIGPKDGQWLRYASVQGGPAPVQIDAGLQKLNGALASISPALLKESAVWFLADF